MSVSAIFAPGLFDGQHVFITGGGTGIGFGCALEMGRLGARVTLAARREEVLNEAVSKLTAQGIDAAAYPLNIRDNDAVLATLERIVAERGLPDHLVNNAGGQFAAKAQDISANGFRAVMDLNVQGTWQMSSAFATAHREADSPGRIINMVFAHTDAMERFAHAAAARAAIVNLTRTLALEWGEQKMLVNAVGPGPILTEGIAQYDATDSGEARIDQLPVPRWGLPQDVAWLVAYLLSPAGDWITGSYFPIDGGAQLVGRRWEV
jgi:NAD(P)-dependent dehydrogenase (short-subunit alcohol dehydrogenase family)